MKFRFSSVGQYNKAINQLLTELNLGVEDPIFHLGTAEKRLRNLEALKEQRGSKAAALVTTPKPAVASPAQPKPASPGPAPAPAPAKPAGLTRQQHLAILAVVDRPAHAQVREEWDNDSVALETYRACYQAHLRIPGMPEDSELAAEFWRPETLTGLARTQRSFKADAITRILKRR